MFRSPIRMHSAGADAESQSHLDDRPVGALIDEMGFGWSQIKFAILGGGIWFADGAELLLISSVSQAASKEWNLGGFERGFVVSVVFFGILVGNVMSGPIGDNLGRRPCLVSSFLGIFVFSIASSLAASYSFLCVFRFFVGVSMGVGQPAWTSMGSEVAPSWARTAMTSASFGFFTCGEMYSAGLVMADDPSMHNLHWRSLLLLGAIPSLLFCILSSIFLHESPVYLANKGKAEEAKVVLEAIREENSAHTVALRFSTRACAPAGERGWSVVMGQLSTVFGKRMFLTTFVVMFSCFILNLNYFGTMYAFPQLLPNIVQGSSAASELMIGALWEFPGNALGCLFGFIMPRKRAMKVYLGLSFMALVAFPLGAVAKGTETWWTDILLFGGYYGVKCFVQIGFVIVYQYAVEVYPTDVRITGLALNLAAGRSAATASSIVFEMVVLLANFKVFFFGIAFGCLINALLIDFLRYETMGMQLKDSIGAGSSTDSDSDRSRAPSRSGSSPALPGYPNQSESSGTPGCSGSYGTTHKATGA